MSKSDWGLTHWALGTLWALMAFVGFGFLLPRASTLVVALLALSFAWGVEFSQLYRAPWIDAIRATIPGKLVLGNTFAWTAKYFREAAAFMQTNEGFDEEGVADMLESAEKMEREA